MSAHSQAADAFKPRPEALSRVRLRPGEVPHCCGQPMQPRLAEAHDRIGHSLFVAIWRCPSCGRSVY